MNTRYQLCRLCALAALSVTLFAGCTTMQVRGTVKDWDSIAANINPHPSPRVDQKMLAQSYDTLVKDQKNDGDGTGSDVEYVGDAFVDSYRHVVNDLPDVTVAQSLFKEGLDLFTLKKYSAAAKRFSSCQWKCTAKDTVLKEDAMFMEAECYFFDNRYSKAFKQYNKVAKNYENSRYSDRMAARLFAIGRYWENMYDKYHYNTFAPNFWDKRRPMFDTNGNARKAFTSAQLQNANGTFSDAAVMACGNNLFRDGQYTEASEQYDHLCENYPNSKYIVRAYLLNLQCKLQMYIGSHYDSKPLEDAEKIANHLINFYGPELDAQMRSEIKEIQSHFAEQKAQRDLAIAEYYKDKKYYGAARQYYGYVQKDYPGTESAQQARNEYQKIANLPSEPAKKFEWLKYIFPED